ncbi:WSCD family member AAEL009094 [Amyelois transitella]|uniref:WSCD family member AAEL009094 n=1 Tax=Amyelois transitella TaxID=680683 RepID=UPI00298F6285|nr:WSCD family member AAEL009094 [Amyelois transitella]
MSRKSVFLVAVTVVMLYFSIILFMLSPLHGAKSSYYGNNYMNHFGYRQTPQVQWCKELKWRSPPAPKVTALASFPGSGNTWLRYLLQQSTGIVTGSIYMDYGLKLHGFPAENTTDGSVLVVKTHGAPPLDTYKFDAAVLLIRNPRDAILADFNRLFKGHIGTAPKYAFKRRSNNNKRSDWATHVYQQLREWEVMHQKWLTQFPGPIHLVFYEVLVRDTRTELNAILQFLNHTVSEDDMDCTILNKEGIYRRKNKHQDFDPYTADMYKGLEQVRQRILRLVNEYQKKNNVTVMRKA